MSDLNLKKGIDCIGVCVVYYCHDGQGNMLLAKRSQNARDEKGTWDVGGGAVELFDTIEDTLRKEIREEYRTEVVKYEFMHYRDVHRVLPDGRKTHWLALDFVVQVNREMVQIGEPEKFDELCWCKLGQLPAPLHSQLMIGIELGRGKLIQALKC